MDSKALFGIVPALITPLKEDGTLDIDGLERLIEYMISSGVHGIFIAGYTGEGAALPYKELRELAKNTVIFVNGRVPVCCGVLETGTEKTIATSKRLFDEGMDFFSTTVPFPPPYIKQEEIIKHYEMITSSTEASWMIYGNSGTLPNIEPETFHELAMMEKVKAIKDTRPDYEGHIKNLMAVREDDISILCGGEYLVGPGLLAGADGNISGATNVFPKLFVHLYNAAKANNVKEVNRCAEAIVSLHMITRADGACWLSAFKYACAKLKLTGEYCLTPVQHLNQEHKYMIDEVMEKLYSWR